MEEPHPEARLAKRNVEEVVAAGHKGHLVQRIMARPVASVGVAAAGPSMAITRYLAGQVETVW